MHTFFLKYLLRLSFSCEKAQTLFIVAERDILSLILFQPILQEDFLALHTFQYIQILQIMIFYPDSELYLKVRALTFQYPNSTPAYR